MVGEKREGVGLLEVCPGIKVLQVLDFMVCCKHVFSRNVLVLEISPHFTAQLGQSTKNMRRDLTLFHLLLYVITVTGRGKEEMSPSGGKRC